MVTIVVQLNQSCDHEEADTRMVIHVQDAAEKGNRHFVIRTVDTDVIVIFIGLFFSLKKSYPGIDIWISFGRAENKRIIHIHTVCLHFQSFTCFSCIFW